MNEAIVLLYSLRTGDIALWISSVPSPISAILYDRGRLAQRLAQVLYTHKAGGSNPSSPTTDLIGSQQWKPFFFGPSAWDSNPTGCGAEETRKRFPAQHARAVGPKRKRAASAARGHPSSPTIKLETVLERGPFLFGPISWDSNPQGCGAEETRSVFQRSTRGAKRRSGCGRRSRTRTSLIAHH